jgi:hypothetical protein
VQVCSHFRFPAPLPPPPLLLLLLPLPLPLPLPQASRVLQPSGLLVVAFGPDCLREKALAAWLSRDMQERVQLLTE